jgi:hypothetical protein
LTVVVLDQPRFWLPAVSTTFHGRDLFGPVTAHLALGVSFAEVGSSCDGIETLPFPSVNRTADAGGRAVTARGEVIHVDRFGNLIANLTASDLPPDPVVEVAGRRIVGLAEHFQPPEDTLLADQGLSSQSPSALIALIGSTGLLEIAVPNGSAAAVLGAGDGTAILVTARI